MRFTTAFLLAILTTLPDLASAFTGFATVCKNIRLRKPAFLTADCRHVDDKWNHSVLKLDDCLGNISGRITCKKELSSFPLF